MQRLGARAERIRAVIGPCIQAASYEVGPDLRDAVLAQDPADARFFAPGAREQRWQFDLPAYCRARLAAAGVAAEALGADTLADEDALLQPSPPHPRRRRPDRPPDLDRRAVMLPLLFSCCPLAGAARRRCGGLPRPFEGDPGATALRLAVPPPSRLAVPTPTAALLPQSAAETWAGAVADDLVGQEVPGDRRARASRRLAPGDDRRSESGRRGADLRRAQSARRVAGLGGGRAGLGRALVAGRSRDAEAGRRRRRARHRQPAHRDRGGAPAERSQQPDQPSRPHLRPRRHRRAGRRQPRSSPSRCACSCRRTARSCRRSRRAPTTSSPARCARRRSPAGSSASRCAGACTTPPARRPAR